MYYPLVKSDVISRSKDSFGSQNQNSLNSFSSNKIISVAVLPGFSTKFNIQEAMKTGFTKFSGVGTLQEVSSLVSR